MIMSTNYCKGKMLLKNINIWYVSSFLISLTVAIPIVTVFTSFFEDTSNYFQILKQTFFLDKFSVRNNINTNNKRKKDIRFANAKSSKVIQAL